MTLRLEELTPPALDARLPEWQALARSAATPNPFLEPWALRPALTWLTAGEPIRLLVARSGESLDALIPLRVTRGPGGLPTLSVWRHLYALVGAPLIRAGREAAVLDAVRGYARDTLGPHGLLVLEHLPERSGVGRAAVQSGAVARERWERPLWRPGARPSEGRKRRKTLRRLGRRLREVGAVTWERVRETAAAERLLDAFLRLETSGWKSRSGTAVAQSTAHTAFFRGLLREAASGGHLDGHMLLVDDVPIAANIDVVTGAYGFSLKTAYDDAWAPFSPGLQLEQHILDLHEREGHLRWLDSCASGHTPALDAIWPARLAACSLLVPTTGRISRLMVSSLPLLREMKQRFASA